MTPALAAATVPWEAHPEVWFLVLGSIFIGWYATRVLEPKAVAAGYPPIRQGQKTWYVLGVLGMWAASDWPIHEIAEEHLYFVHMFQHLLISMLLPAAFVLATPSWIFDLVVPRGSTIWNLLSKVSRPVVAGVIFNGLTLFLHWSRIVQLSSDSGTAHFLFHAMVFSAGIIMWLPVIGPVEEWRISPLGQCVYLFCMSIMPTVPGGWLVFAEDVVYRSYDTPDRLWGIDVLTDQQAAGAVMKLVGGFFLWAVIIVIFSKMAIEHRKGEEEVLDARDRRINAELKLRDAVDEIFETQ